MKPKIVAGLVIAIALFVAGAGVFRAQEVLEPPEPPEPPDPPEVFLMTDGHARLGVTLAEVTAEKAQQVKLSAPTGALVESVQKESAAAKAGIEKDDVIVEFDGVKVRSSAELRRLIQETPAGRTVAIKVVRSGHTRTLDAKLEAPAKNEFHFGPEIRIPSVRIPEFNFNFGMGQTSLGISGDDLTTQLAQYFGVKDGKGVLVREVITGSAAEKAGLKAGDVIVKVDAARVGSVEELRSALNENFADDTRKVTLGIVRDHHDQTLTVELTRSTPYDRHLTGLVGSLGAVQTEQAKALADQYRQQSEQLRKDIEKQKSLMQGEWQRQLKEQMRDLKEQLKTLQNVYVAREADAAI